MKRIVQWIKTLLFDLFLLLAGSLLTLWIQIAYRSAMEIEQFRSEVHAVSRTLMGMAGRENDHER